MPLRVAGISLGILCGVVACVGGCSPQENRRSDCPEMDLTVLELGSQRQADLNKQDVAELQEFANQFVGSIEVDAQSCAEDAGLVFRPVARDGESYLVTQDYNLLRINVEVDNDVVSRAYLG